MAFFGIYPMAKKQYFIFNTLVSTNIKKNVFKNKIFLNYSNFYEKMVSNFKKSTYQE